MNSRHLALVAAVVMFLAACGGQAKVIAPFTVGDGAEAGGWAVLQLGPRGTTLRFVPNTNFAVGFFLKNTSRRAVTLLAVQSLDPPRSLVQQQGTTLVAWNPPPCPHAISCPALGFLKQPYGAETAHPITIGSEKQAGVQLDYRMAGCAAVPLANPAAASTVTVTFRSNGKLERQSLTLRGTRLRLRMPSARDCAPRPKSTISVSAPYASSSLWTIPTSTGDSCRTKTGVLSFVSRLYQAPNAPAVRVEIILPRFSGRGLYRTVARAASSRGPARVTAVVGIGIHGWVHFHSQTAQVTVTTVGPHRFGGRFRATIVGYRHGTFRAYGAWRCTTPG